MVFNATLKQYFSYIVERFDCISSDTDIPYLGLYNAHWCIMRTPSWPWKSPEKLYIVNVRMTWNKIRQKKAKNYVCYLQNPYSDYSAFSSMHSLAVKVSPATSIMVETFTSTDEVTSTIDTGNMAYPPGLDEFTNKLTADDARVLG
jgi:hypothetical protein